MVTGRWWVIFLVILIGSLTLHGALAQHFEDSSQSKKASAALSEESPNHKAKNILHAITRVVLQISLILMGAKIGSEVCERYLRQPGVLGELVAGMIIGPYALGKFAQIPGLGPLFPPPNPGSTIPVSVELYAFAQVAVVILLFIAGLETDYRQFMRYGGPASVVAAGGVITPFFLGAWATTLFVPGVSSMAHPVALFMGAAMVATSVGITARVLSDIHKLDTPEGVTILAGAVVDDVLGILVLAIVVSLASGGGESLSIGRVGLIAVKAIGVWLGIMGIGILLAKRIEKVLHWFKSDGATLALAMALCFLAAGVAELFGLAMIIGSYAIGLALSSREKLSEFLVDHLRPLYQVMVPIFFVVMGMLVDFGAMRHAVIFGIVLSLLGVVSKVFGCGLPALGVGFNRVGAFRIGIGMLPRGEVALIVAGVGLAAGAIDSAMFGVAIMMTMVTTLLAPIILVPAFRKGGSGRRGIPIKAKET